MNAQGMMPRSQAFKACAWLFGLGIVLGLSFGEGFARGRWMTFKTEGGHFISYHYRGSSLCEDKRRQLDEVTAGGAMWVHTPWREKLIVKAIGCDNEFPQ